MFYAHYVLSKKGPLARIWLAAHWDKKLTKAHVFETDIGDSVEAIIQPKVKLALRTSGHLLLGVVRIYSRKAKYLLTDCNEAFVKIKMAFRPGVVDLPEENREAAVATITLPETFHDFETTMPDLSDIDVQAQFSVNQSRPEEITMREDLGNITLVGDDGFGDMGFDGNMGNMGNMIHDAHLDDTLYVKNPDQLLDQEKADNEKPMDVDFGQTKDGQFPDNISDFEGPAGVEDDDDDDNDNFGGGVDTDLFAGDNFEAGGLFEEPPVPEVPAETQQAKEGEETKVDDADATHATTEQTTTMPDQTTLIPNEAEMFALEPIDVTSMGTERKSKRKRKLVIDEQKGIPSETMKLQLSDTSDIVTTLDLAPPTKKLMHWKETGGVEKLFALPGRSMICKRVTRLFNKNLVTRPYHDEEPESLDLESERLEHTLEEREVARAEQSVPEERFEASHLEPSSIAEEPSILEPPRLSVADSTISQAPVLEDVPPPPIEDNLDSTLVAPENVSMPEPELPPPAMSSDDEDNDAFDEDLPSLPASPAESEKEDEDEEGEDGTEEDEDEKRWTKRTQQLLHIMSKQLSKSESVSFHGLLHQNNRKQAASKFYTLLVLKKHQAVDVVQDGPYGDISVTQGPHFGLAF